MSTSPLHRIPEFTLGDRLRKARELTGLGVREFAAEIGVSHGTITNAESDRRTVRPITIKAYAMRTGVPVEWLETGIAPTQPTPDGGKEWSGAVAGQKPAGFPFRLIMGLAA